MATMLRDALTSQQAESPALPIPNPLLLPLSLGRISGCAPQAPCVPPFSRRDF